MQTILLLLSLGACAAYGPAAARGPRPALRAAASRLPAAARVAMVDDLASAEAEEEVTMGDLDFASLAKEAGMSEEEYIKTMGFDEAIDEADYEEEVAEEPEEMSAEAAKIMSGMRSSSGVEFAPWMKVDAEKIAKAKKEREERKARQAAAAVDLRGDTMLIDPQAAELGAGGGLKSKVLSEEEVELRWSTQDEAGNKGFVVQRRRGGQQAFDDLASFEGFAPLRTKGPAGGDYVYLDDTADVGTWVYRIVDCDANDRRSAVCQKLVEIDSKSEATFTVVVGAVIATLALGLVVAATLADPIQTTDKGSAFF